MPISTDQPERAADDATEHGHNPHIPDAGLEASQPTNFDDFPPPELDGDDLGIVPLNMVNSLISVYIQRNILFFSPFLLSPIYLYVITPFSIRTKEKVDQTIPFTL